jgi:hypothetical protein
MTAGSQTASSSAMSDVATGDATVSLFWCPNYDCKQAKQVGFIDFTVYSWSS